MCTTCFKLTYQKPEGWTADDDARLKKALDRAVCDAAAAHSQFILKTLAMEFPNVKASIERPVKALLEQDEMVSRLTEKLTGKDLFPVVGEVHPIEVFEEFLTRAGTEKPGRAKSRIEIARDMSPIEPMPLPAGLASFYDTATAEPTADLGFTHEGVIMGYRMLSPNMLTGWASSGGRNSTFTVWADEVAGSFLVASRVAEESQEGRAMAVLARHVWGDLPVRFDSTITIGTDEILTEAAETTLPPALRERLDRELTAARARRMTLPGMWHPMDDGSVILRDDPRGTASIERLGTDKWRWVALRSGELPVADTDGWSGDCGNVTDAKRAAEQYLGDLPLPPVGPSR
jgi:hypothetical protein